MKEKAKPQIEMMTTKTMDVILRLLIRSWNTRRYCKRIDSFTRAFDVENDALDR